MRERQFNLAFVFPAYAGNGGFSSHCVDIRRWWGDVYHKCRSDPNIAPFVGEIFDCDPCDTPVPMVRNAAVEAARAAKADLLIMVDSDQAPDFHLNEPGSKPFFESSFEFFRKHYERGPCLIGAPYCGPPPHENAYIFKWQNIESDDPNHAMSLGQLEREHAAIMAGIQPVAAVATGLIMLDMRMFDLLKPPYFDYEYKDQFQAEKASTEDVVTTRDMSLVGEAALGYNPVYCNFDAWAGHHKPKCVGKPRVLTSNVVSQRLAKAIQQNIRPDSRLVLISQGRPSINGASCQENGQSPTPARPRSTKSPSASPSPKSTAIRRSGRLPRGSSGSTAG